MKPSSSALDELSVLQRLSENRYPLEIGFQDTRGRLKAESMIRELQSAKILGNMTMLNNSVGSAGSIVVTPGKNFWDYKDTEYKVIYKDGLLIIDIHRVVSSSHFEIPINGTRGKDLLRIMFKTKTSRARTWEWDELVEEIDVNLVPSKESRRIPYDSSRYINQKVESNTSGLIQELIGIKNNTYRLNPKYIA